MTTRDPLHAGGVVAHASTHRPAVERALARLADADAVRRLHARDASLWPGDPAEVGARLGWLDVPEGVPEAARQAAALVESARREGLVTAAVIGMGGSSLAPEVFGHVLRRPGGLAPAILDSTHPDAVRASATALDPLATLFVVSSKSGTTVETASLARHHLARVEAALEAAGDGGPAGSRFVAITDPGSALERWSREQGFRAVFQGPPDVGGRFSALTPFGLVPAALFGADVGALLDAAGRAARSCAEPRAEDNPAALLAAALAGPAAEGRTALTLWSSPAIAPLGAWIEQLVAESLGKRGVGILPVVGEPPSELARLGNDRIVVALRLAGDASHDGALGALAEAGHPVVTIDVASPNDLAGLMVLWMHATALAGHLLGVQPFDQPNVEAAKRRARERLAAGGAERPAAVAWLEGPATAQADRLEAFLGAPGPCAYVALLAWVPPTEATDAALTRLARALAARIRRPVTTGYGPRYLHSTGQLHKGDAGRGRFVALLAEPEGDVPIPGDAAGATFGRLLRAQAEGDLAALADAGRRTLALRLEGPPVAALDRLVEALDAT